MGIRRDSGYEGGGRVDPRDLGAVWGWGSPFQGYHRQFGVSAARPHADSGSGALSQSPVTGERCPDSPCPIWVGGCPRTHRAGPSLGRLLCPPGGPSSPPDRVPLGPSGRTSWGDSHPSRAQSLGGETGATSLGDGRSLPYLAWVFPDHLG